MSLQPCLGDWTTHTPFDAHYFYQGAWLARELVKKTPKNHTDIGSSVLTIGVISAFVPTTFVDFRPAQTDLSGLSSVSGNILYLAFPDASLDSLSCLHVIEHIGLGRYGDPIDTEGSKKAAVELQRVLVTGGRLYLSVPVGRERVCFNAHRVHAIKSVLAMFLEMKLVSFSLVDDESRFHVNTSIQAADALSYGCGLFVLEKL